MLALCIDSYKQYNFAGLTRDHACTHSILMQFSLSFRLKSNQNLISSHSWCKFTIFKFTATQKIFLAVERMFSIVKCSYYDTRNLLQLAVNIFVNMEVCLCDETEEFCFSLSKINSNYLFTTFLSFFLHICSRDEFYQEIMNITQKNCFCEWNESRHFQVEVGRQSEL